MPAKAHEPTDETRAQVTALASFGLPQEDIAEFIGVSHVTLRKYYQPELKLSAIKANAAVGEYLFSLASGHALKQGATHGDCKTAAMFWAKTRMGWRETSRLEHSGPEGGPMQMQDVTPRERIAGKLTRIAAAASEAVDPNGTE
jgi:DNA-binding XRE family transcriptional regulator